MGRANVTVSKINLGKHLLPTLQFWRYYIYYSCLLSRQITEVEEHLPVLLDLEKAMCLQSEMCPANRKDSSDNSVGMAANTWSACKGRRPSIKRKSRRVLYPPMVKKYLPREEKDPTKKWLVILGAIVFLQIYCEDATECDIGFSIDIMVPIPLESRPPSAGLWTETSFQQPANVSIFFFMAVDPETECCWRYKQWKKLILCRDKLQQMEPDSKVVQSTWNLTGRRTKVPTVTRTLPSSLPAENC